MPSAVTVVDPWSDSRFSSSLSFLFKGLDDEVVDSWFDSDSVVVAVVAAVDAGLFLLL